MWSVISKAVVMDSFSCFAFFKAVIIFKISENVLGLMLRVLIIGARIRKIGAFLNSLKILTEISAGISYLSKS